MSQLTWQTPDGSIRLFLGDCRDVLPTLSGIDAVVVDPPYGLSFMGKAWDYDVPQRDMWELVLAAMKPGSHLLSFFGTRTYHRGVVNIEDAGFEIRDQLAWIYGSGFPKSLDVSKAIDKAAGAEREIVAVEKSRFTVRPENASSWKSGSAGGDSRPRDADGYRFDVITAPATEAARQWNGWGTALKPAQEPIVLARKPLVGTVAANVLKHGVGGLNIDGCRVEVDPTVDDMLREVSRKPRVSQTWEEGSGFKNETNARTGVPATGRWPANIIHDGSDEVLAVFPETQSGSSAARFFYCAKASKRDRDEGLENEEETEAADFDHRPSGDFSSRMKRERKPVMKRNTHPTVKPTALMQYLCRLVTPPSGVILDTHMGSGTTGKAAIREGFPFVGIERDEASFATAVKRIEAELAKRPLFEGACA